MTYDFILSIAYYICGCFYALFGAYIVAVNTKNKINRLFVMVTSSMAIWSIANAISNSADTAEKSLLEMHLCFDGAFFGLLLHFALISQTDSN